MDGHLLDMGHLWGYNMLQLLIDKHKLLIDILMVIDTLEL